MPNVRHLPCCLCPQPATHHRKGFEWCARHADNLDAVLRGDLKLPPKPLRVPPNTVIARRTRSAQVVAQLRKHGYQVPDLAEALGWSLESTRTALRELLRTGRVVKRQGSRPEGGRKGRGFVLWSLGRGTKRRAA